MTRQYTDLELMQWRPVYNIGSATINPREICQVVTGADGFNRSIAAVKQPTSTFSKTYCVNGPTAIAAGSHGKACFGPIVLVAYDTGSPAIDELFGPTDAQGTVVKDTNPVLSCIRVVDSTNKLLLARVIEHPRAVMISAQVDEASGVLYTDTTFSIDNVAVISPQNGYLDEDPTTVTNLLMAPYDDDAVVIAFRNEATDPVEWWAVGAVKSTTCPT